MDALTTIAKFINSPPGQLAAGAALGGIVWKFFERVESVLSENTKLEIAVWLLAVQIGQKVEPWPETFAKVFNRVFGATYLSWKSFRRSVVVSYGSAVLSFVIYTAANPKVMHQFAVDIITATITSAAINPDVLRAHRIQVYIILGLVLIVGLALTIPVILFAINALPGYLSLLETRYVLGLMMRTHSTVILLMLLCVDILVTGVTSWISMLIIAHTVGGSGPALDDLTSFTSQPGSGPPAAVSFYPAFFTSIWLWLYAGSGFLLKAARRFDIGFDWFNRHFDIEKKPLQSIGLVAGALVAVAYWTGVIVMRTVR